MEYRQFIQKKFGTDDGSNLLDPEFYSDDQLADDRFTAEMEQEEAREERNRLNDEKERLKDAGVGQPPSEKEALAREIESIDLVLEQTEARFQKATDELALFRVIEAVRKRMNTGEKHYEQAMDSTTEQEIQAEVRSVARDLDRDAGKINSILKSLKISTRISKSSREQTGKSKYVKEMERREEEREYSASATAETSASSSRDRNRS
jgi:hypothetical protein